MLTCQINIQSGLKFRTFEFRIHSKTEHFYVLYWNVLFSNLYIKRPSLERPFRKFRFRMVGTRTERLWSIWIPNAIGIRAPTVHHNIVCTSQYRVLFRVQQHTTLWSKFLVFSKRFKKSAKKLCKNIFSIGSKKM